MTNKEALRILHCPSAYLTDEDSEFAHTIPLFSRAYGQAMAVAFEALKQADALDKIRAEIQSLRDCSCSCSDGIIDDVEDIIDKYKAGEKE